MGTVKMEEQLHNGMRINSILSDFWGFCEVCTITKNGKIMWTFWTSKMIQGLSSLQLQGQSLDPLTKGSWGLDPTWGCASKTPL